MTRVTAERYRDIYKHHAQDAQDARERGLQDERTARTIDRMSMSSMLNNIDERNLIVAAAVLCSLSILSSSMHS